MGARVNVNGSVEYVKDIKVNVNGVVRPVKEGLTNVNGTLYTFFTSCSACI